MCPILRAVWVIPIAVVLVSCGDGTEPDQSSLQIVGAPASLRQGDVVDLGVTVRDGAGATVTEPVVAWSVLAPDGGMVASDGRLVAYATGTLRVVAAAGALADTASIAVTARGLSGSFGVVGHGSAGSHTTTDLWVYGDAGYTGTITSPTGVPGNTLLVWNLAGADPVLSDSVRVSAATVNDVKVRQDGALAVVSQEGGAASEAFTMLDLTDPHHPTVVGVFAAPPGEQWHGVHNLWIEGDYVYAAIAATGDRRLWVVDISDPANPVRVAEYHAGASHLHDVYVRDGLAFLSHMGAGLVILDVGNGVAGGSPSNPVEVSRLELGGSTHNAWYWPETGYVFVGEEDFQEPGYMHVVDATDLANPVEVGSYRVAGDAPHNFWLDEEREILYVAWYSQGLHALDVSGRLLGRLDQQGRRITAIQYDGPSSFPCFGGSDTCTWAPQLHDGLVYVSDMASGLWKLEPGF